LRPFVWRKHLDFAAIQDAHDMRLRIRDHKGLHGKLRLAGHDMKLGRGGIREIEFFTQTRQLIAGGRDPDLRVRGTHDGLTRLAAAGWVPEDTAATLYDHYRFHRQVEHRLQMIGDQQTHKLPTSPDGFDRLAAFMGRNTTGLQAELTARLTEVHELTEGFFAPGQATSAPVPDFGTEITARWRNYPALRSDRAMTIFKRLRPEIMTHLAEAAKPAEALAQFDRFLAGLPAGVQLFSLFEANPQLTRLVVDICATAPALAQYLSRNAGVFDAVIGGGFFTDWPGVGGLRPLLDVALASVDDDEARLDAARRWSKEWHFRIGVHHLRGLIDADTAGRQYAELAETVVAGLWPHVVASFQAKHGRIAGQGAAVLGMGSVGASRLNTGSDLDLILIFDADDDATSDGARPLSARPYYARLTQALVTALTAPMAEGRLYEVDMRLRPSGRQGPVATSFAAFRDYQQTQAWTWEHLALTRARPIAGNPGLMDEIETFRRALISAKSDGPTVLSDVAEMRDRIAAAKTPQGDWDVKIGPGRLLDIELLAQTAALRAGVPVRDVPDQVQAGVASGWLNAADAGALLQAYGLFWRVQATARLLTPGVLNMDELGEGGRRLILRETGCDSATALAAALTDLSARADTIITRRLTT
jgi:glutamate-ammonia-ligase adenylyltransferase